MMRGKEENEWTNMKMWRNNQRYLKGKTEIYIYNCVLILQKIWLVQDDARKGRKRMDEYENVAKIVNGI